MEAKHILADLKQKKYAPVYFLMGEEPYYIDLISEFIEKNILDESEREFNLSILYGRDVDTATIVAEAKRYPMMSDKQIVIVKEAQNVKNIELLENYITNSLDSTILVICYKYKKVDKRTNFAKVLGKQGVLFESERIKDYKVADWIAAYIAEQKIKADSRTIQMLADYLGNDLSKIINELNKLMISLPEGGSITPELIEVNIGISKDFNVFELSESLAKRDIVKSNRIANYFAANPKDHPFPVTVATLFNYFTKLLQYNNLPDKSRAAAASEMKVNPFFVDGYAKAAVNYPDIKIKRVIQHLREYDLRSKGVDNESTDHGQLLKELVWLILH